jgi:hypothetical protein
MKDFILDKFFEIERWKYAIKKGIVKRIDRAVLYKLCNPDVRAGLYLAIKNGEYAIKPPHTAEIPKKDSDEKRTVFVNEPDDRVILSIANDLLFELMAHRIHPACLSYQKGVGCGKIVTRVSEILVNAPDGFIGFKSDLSKYFDSVPIRFIDSEFDAIEAKYGHSALIDMLREYYHNNIYFDTNKNVAEKYQSLKQGCAVASYLADCVLYDTDAILSRQNGSYWRYSDDMLYLGEDYENVMQTLQSNLAEKEIKLNPKKVEYLSKDKWFRFLGFSIKGDKRTLSKDWLKNFISEIKHRTIRKKGCTKQQAINSIMRYLYVGDGEHSPALQMLPYVNCENDLHILNNFMLDCIRACETGKKKIGGVGYVTYLKDGCFLRSKGRNVKANKQKTEKDVEGFYSLVCMQNLLRTSRDAYDTLVLSLK